MAAKQARRHVGIVQNTELACYRDILRGINTFASMQANWQIELFSPLEDFALQIHRNEVNGLLIGPIFDLPQVQAAIEDVNGMAIGVAAQFAFRGLPGLIEIESDDIAVGKLAAEHFLTKGFQHFAFLGTRTQWSELRRDGFVERLAAQDITPAEFCPEASGPGNSFKWEIPHFGKEVAAWIHALPKPLAVFVCNDLRGRSLVHLCRAEEIRVPEDVAILSVDNDDLLCELAQPQLSSVAVPWKKIGFQAAMTLEKMFAGESNNERRILIGPECVIERHSSDTLAITDPDVSAAIRFIRSHSHAPIGVEDVLREIPVSRRSLEKRFRLIMGRSPLEEIRKAHIERAKFLLSETDLPMPDVADKSGFSSAAWFSKAFHDLTGETATQYRMKFKTR